MKYVIMKRSRNYYFTSIKDHPTEIAMICLNNWFKEVQRRNCCINIHPYFIELQAGLINFEILTGIYENLWLTVFTENPPCSKLV